MCVCVCACVCAFPFVCVGEFAKDGSMEMVVNKLAIQNCGKNKSQPVISCRTEESEHSVPSWSLNHGRSRTDLPF